jgi:flagellar biosynthesis protein FlhF
MKVRSYKGRSLEKIYGSIRSELGPDAVIVSTHQDRKRSLMGILSGSGVYEVVAVVDDTAAAKHQMNGAARSEELHRWALLQAHKWEQFETAMDDMRSQIRTLSRRTPSGMALPNGEALPAYARNWDPRFREMLMQTAPEALTDNGDDACRGALGSMLRVEEHFPVRSENGPHIIVFAGPTGSGKTTTLAKLAAQWSLDEELKIGLITTDTYRVAAVEQIREYATLLGVDLRVAFSAGEAARAVEDFQDRDVILVDTPGRSHFDKAGLTGLKGIISGMGKVTVMLVLPATVDRRDVPGIIENFRILHIQYLVMTKIDETRHFDLLTTATCETDYPIAFFTDGQRVPQDIRAASLEETVRMLVPEGKQE